MQTLRIKRLALAAIAAAGIVATSASPAQATFPGKDGRIAVSVWRPNFASPLPAAGALESRVVSVAPDGSDRRAQRVAGKGQPQTLDHSPDGKWLVVSRDLGVIAPGPLRSVLGPANGTVNWTVSTRPQNGYVPRPTNGRATWTPNGKLLFAGWTAEPGVLLRTSPWRPLQTVFTPPADSYVDSAAMSPNGKTLAVGTSEGIYLANADGTNPRRLSERRSGALDWSPDSTRLLVSTEVAAPDPVTVINVADGKATELPVRGGRAVWSPTGTQLAYLQPEESSGGQGYLGPLKLQVANLDGQGERTVTTLKGAQPEGESEVGFDISWQPLP